MEKVSLEGSCGVGFVGSSASEQQGTGNDERAAMESKH